MGVPNCTIVHKRNNKWANLKEEDGLMGGLQPEHIRKKMSASHTGKKYTEEQRKRMSMAQKKVVHHKASEETKRKMSISMRGILRSEETKRKMSESNLLKPILTCPHCGKSSRANIKRYHFNNCKQYGN